MAKEGTTAILKYLNTNKQYRINTYTYLWQKNIGFWMPLEKQAILNLVEN